MNEKVNFLDLEEVDELSINQFYEEIENKIDGNSDGPLISPGTHNQARNWVYAYQKISSEIERLKEEYIPFLMERYINPVKSKIEKHERAQDLIKEGLMEFLENIQETKANFPDLGTIFIQNPQDKIIYPEDENVLAETIFKTNSEFVKVSYKLDKNKIKSNFKETGELPSTEIIVEKSEPTLVVRKAKI